MGSLKEGNTRRDLGSQESPGLEELESNLNCPALMCNSELTFLLALTNDHAASF